MVCLQGSLLCIVKRLQCIESTIVVKCILNELMWILNHIVDNKRRNGYVNCCMGSVVYINF